MSVLETTTHIEENISSRSDEAWNYEFHVRNQEYVVLSICENKGEDNGSVSAIKVFGMYKTLEEANKASSLISKENDFFNVYVAESNAWVPVPPSNDFIENVEYQEEQMRGIKASFEKSKERNATQISKDIKNDREKNKKNTNKIEN